MDNVIKYLILFWLLSLLSVREGRRWVDEEEWYGFLILAGIGFVLLAVLTLLVIIGETPEWFYRFANLLKK